MAKNNEIRLDVSSTDDFVEPASVLGTLVEDADVEAQFILKHPYPDFEVADGWFGRGRDVSLIFSGPRVGQRIPCTRG